MKRTKIVATLGPASQDPEIITKLIKNGVNLFRFNMKYNTTTWHNHEIEIIRKISKSLKTSVGIMVDIPRVDFHLDIMDFDYVALSYLKSAREIVDLKKRFLKQNKQCGVIAKIENGRAIENLDSIVTESDGVMVARGDLGEETPLKELAYFQKKIIDISRIKNKPVIVATQMLLSMTDNKLPTRAEATDVANAVLDGTDAVMLSEETALGKYPVEAVKMMAEIAEYNENIGDLRKIILTPASLTDSLFQAAADIVIKSNNHKIGAIIIFTKSGFSVRAMSKYRLNIPIVAISDQEKSLMSLCLSYGVTPYYKKFIEKEYKNIDPIFSEIKSFGYLKNNETVMVIHGSNWFDTGSTNQISLKTL